MDSNAETLYQLPIAITVAQSKIWQTRLRGIGKDSILNANHLGIILCEYLNEYLGLAARLKDGDTIVVGEGYLFEFEARGLLKMGSFVPEVVLEFPNVVRELHHEFVRAGSDVVLAFTYYGHREKLRLVGRETDIEKLNRTALRIAREVATETGTLMAGNICNSTIFTPNDPKVQKEVYNMFKEQVLWAVEGGADFILGETFEHFAEGELALKAVKEFGKGVPAVITFASFRDTLLDGISYGEGCRRLEEAGAAVVGLNCSRGPVSLLPLLKEVRQACKGPVAGLPVCYRTNVDAPTFFDLDDVDNPSRAAFPIGLLAWQCTQAQITNFTREAQALGIQYIGLCCGNRANYMRTMAEALGRKPPASRYSPDMSLHFSQLKDERRMAIQAGLPKRLTE